MKTFKFEVDEAFTCRAISKVEVRANSEKEALEKVKNIANDYFRSFHRKEDIVDDLSITVKESKIENFDKGAREEFSIGYPIFKVYKEDCNYPIYIEEVETI